MHQDSSFKLCAKVISSEFEHLDVIYGVSFLSAHILTFNVAPISALCNVLLDVALLP